MHGFEHRSDIGTVPAGEVTVSDEALCTVSPVPGVVPKETAVAPVKPVPVIVTDVPPAAGPEPGKAGPLRSRRRRRLLSGGGRSPGGHTAAAVAAPVSPSSSRESASPWRRAS